MKMSRWERAVPWTVAISCRQCSYIWHFYCNGGLQWQS